ncbi:MAG: MarR family winged helix-turn-helix transcriptional regulator [Nannocystaceae bacterium]|nr:MarR family winged helix-turn-helix transcriptional regulator [Nannocystaceae bacterium]
MGTSKARVRTIAADVSDNCLGLRARLVERVISGVFDRHLRPHGLRITQMTVLTAVASFPQLTPRALGQALDLEKSTVSRTIDRMIERGWVEAVEVVDGRSYALRITTEGESMLCTAYPAWKRAQAELEALLGEPLVDGLGAVAARLNPGLGGDAVRPERSSS